MRRLTMCIALLAALLGAGALHAADTESLVVEANSAFSISDAKRQALRQAVEQVAGVMLHSQTEVQNFAVHKDSILQRTDGYVASYKVLDTHRTPDGLHIVRVKVEVSRTPLKNDLMAMNVLLENLERPKLMVLVDEDYSRMGMHSSALRGMRLAETEINSLLKAKGYDLVDKSAYESARKQAMLRQAIAGDLKAVAALARDTGAQYVLLGEARAWNAGEAVPGTGMHSVQSSLQLKIVSTQSGQILGAVVKDGVAAHISPTTGVSLALRKAAKNAVDGYVAETIMGSFQNQLNNGAPIKLHASGVASFSDYRKIAGFIESLDRTASCTKEGWNKAGGLLVLDLLYRGTSEELAMILDGAEIDKRKVVIQDFAPNRLDVSLK